MNEHSKTTIGTAIVVGHRGGGSVVNVASIGALGALPHIGIHCASMAAVVGFTHSLAMEYAPNNIRANAICPGLVDTPMAEEHQKSFPTPQDAIDALAGRQMLERYARPEVILHGRCGRASGSRMDRLVAPASAVHMPRQVARHS
jgi:NAD(P)-dependent dehydrogenase (short-subunit alcohol dehydrogenase family)